MPTAREGGEYERGTPPLVRGVRGSLSLPPEIILNCSASMFFKGVLCVWDQISVTIFC